MSESRPVALCAALGDETRWQVLELLGDADLSASDLATRMPVTRQAVAKHLRVLEAVGLVEARQDGRAVRYRAVGAALHRLAGNLDAVARGWERRLGDLAHVAEGIAQGEPRV